MSVDWGGAQANNPSYEISLSSDGRYAVFASEATNLVPGDSNGELDVFVRDRLGGTTELVSVSSSGVQANSQSWDASISADGRYVAFHSNATNLVPGDLGGHADIFVRDRLSSTTELVSINSGGAQGNSSSRGPSISADGRYVAFVSFAYNLVPGDGLNGLPDTFVHDRQNGTTECVGNVASGGQPHDDQWIVQASISADGRYVAFRTYQNNLVPGDTDGLPDVFVRDRQSGIIECVSVSSNGPYGGRSSFSPSLSADGRYVVFGSSASTFVPGDTNAVTDIFVRDRQGGTTERVSVNSSGLQGNGGSFSPSISADGRYVAYFSLADNLVLGDTNGYTDAFVHDRLHGTTERMSVDSAGVQANYRSEGYFTSISADGRYVAFESDASNLVPGDTNGSRDIFVRDREHNGYVSLCEPGVAGVIGCPCSNPPSGSDRGCDNSSATGGASLSISGGAYLSSDSLVFRTRNEKSNALSIVLQGTGSIPAGLVYGQGVLCAGGSLRHMYTKSASAGAIRAPDFLAGDPTVHARSAALGDPIQVGQSRWYCVSYRDSIVLGGCSPSSTFNTTQTGLVSWLP